MDGWNFLLLLRSLFLAHQSPCPSVPRAFQPQESRRPSASIAREPREPATKGARPNSRPRKRVPSRASTTLGAKTSSPESRPSWPSSETPGVWNGVEEGA